jgi:sugar/nucleoside kinase (ribokinase family)
MKDLDLCGLCNPLVDIFLDLPEEEFTKLGYEKGTMRLVETDEQAKLLAEFTGRSPGLCSGGSLANSVIALAQLGGKGALCACVGKDTYGDFYRKESEELGIFFATPAIQGAVTGTCLSIITPDAERTMRTALGASSLIAPEYVVPEAIARSKWLFLEGYVFANPARGQDAIREAVRIAKECDTRIAVTCSEPWVVHTFNAALWEVLNQSDLVFCNEEEALALSGANSIDAAGDALSKKLAKVVITGGPKGADIWWDGQKSHVPAFPCEPRDLTGAGDMFAGAFLYGVIHGLAPAEAARRANFLAKLVISQVGARLRGDVKTRWNETV